MVDIQSLTQPGSKESKLSTENNTLQSTYLLDIIID